MPDNLHLKAIDSHEDYFMYGDDKNSLLDRMKMNNKKINIPTILFLDDENYLDWPKINRWLERTFRNFVLYHYDIIN